MKVAEVYEALRAAIDGWPAELGVRLQRRRPLRYRCGFVLADPNMRCTLSFQVSNSGWDRHAGNKLRPHLSFVEPDYPEPLSVRELVGLLDDEHFARVVALNNAIATRAPGPPSPGAVALPDDLYRSYARQFEPSYPERTSEVWLRYRALEDLTSWADLLGDAWPQLTRVVETMPL